MTDLTDPMFNDEDAAREYFEAQRWPNGVHCPHCGNVDPDHDPQATGQVAPSRPLSVQRLPRAFHRDRWLGHGALACPADQVGARLSSDGGEQERRLGSPAHADAWPRLLPHRLVHGAPHSRSDEEDVTSSGPLGGEGKIVEADETYIGKRETPRKLSRGRAPPTKRAKPAAHRSALSSVWSSVAAKPACSM